MLVFIALVVIVFGILFGRAAHARPVGMTLQQLLAACSMDARRNPVTLWCPSGCVVEIANGATERDPPRITIAPACRALK